jgi:mono/diheme cytochrome c family protein
MLSRRWTAFLLIPLYTALIVKPARAIEPEDLRRGLLTTHKDTAKPSVEVMRLEPTVALSLKANESPHPRLRADSGSTVWVGYLNLLREGDYRFPAYLRGSLKVTVAGKVVFDAEAKEAGAVLKEGAVTKLEAGVHSFQASFTRLPGLARAELLWQGPGFRREPLAFDALGHVRERNPGILKLDRDERIEMGKVLVEESGCVRCHQPNEKDLLARGLATHQGPDLSKVGARVHRDWLERWLQSPKHERPATVMPEMFPAGEEGRTERYAVADFLSSLGGPIKGNARVDKGAASRGEKLYNSLGCIACHENRSLENKEPAPKPKPKEDEEAPKPQVLYQKAKIYPLGEIGNKTSPQKLAEFLVNPLAINPSGRMPHLLLKGNEANDLAWFLHRTTIKNLDDAKKIPSAENRIAAFKKVESRADELANFKKLSEKEQFLDLGKRLVIAKSCNNCHTIAPQGKPFAEIHANASLDDVKKPAKQTAGCLANDSKGRGNAPWFGFGAEQRGEIRAFLTHGLTGAGLPAPAYEARRQLERFNCLACHGRDGEGGLSQDHVNLLRRYEKTENAESLLPPPLTGVAHKLRPSWFREVLVNSARARPWMGLRMPQFGEANVGKLHEGIISMEGTESDDSEPKISLNAAKLAAGRALVGKSAFGCISCHDIAGIANTGTRGPDMATQNKRVRYDWYLRWLEQPQRMSPGTRMPNVFTDGKSLMDTILGGKANAQAEAMWAYLSLGPGLPLPEGVEIARHGYELIPDKKPYILRTFMPEAGAKAIAVGFPGGVSLAFDANAARLAYGWSGRFLDASPVWADRGGNPAKVLGERFWRSPAGCPVALAEGTDVPDFAARARDAAYGGPVPEGKIFTGDRRLQFQGYKLSKDRGPIFRYKILTGKDNWAEVRESFGPLRNGGAVGIARHFNIDVPAEHTAWLLAGESSRDPRLFDDKGKPLSLEVKDGKASAPVAKRYLGLARDGQRLAVVGVKSAPEGSRWRLRKVNGLWEAILEIPSQKSARIVAVNLDVWAPFKDEPALIKDMLSSK